MNNNGIKESPSDEEIAEESFRIYKTRQKKYYKKLMKTYSLWMRISSVLIALCFILFSITSDSFFVWMSVAYLIVGLIAIGATNFMREMYHRVYKLTEYSGAVTELLDPSQCICKGKEFVKYKGRRYPRVGCMPDNRESGFLMVSCEDYAYIVEIMKPTPEKLLTT